MDGNTVSDRLNDKRRLASKGLVIGVTVVAALLSLAFLLGIGRTLAEPSTQAATLTVCLDGAPACDYDSIQDAVDAAGVGDTVQVAAGTYTENVTIDKVVTVEGGWDGDFTLRDPAANPTIIKPADETMSVVSILGPSANPGVPPPILDGFSVTGGRADQGGNHGGGIRIIDSNAVVRNNRVYSNTAFLLGGGVWVQRGRPTLENNRIADNVSLAPGQDAFGGGVQLENAGAALISNTVTGNAVSGTVGYGGGLDVLGGAVSSSGDRVERNRSATYGGGICVRGTLSVTTGLVRNNAAASGGGGFCTRAGSRLWLVETDVISNTAVGNGGGIDNVGGSVVLIDSALISNSTTFGGGIQNSADGDTPGVVTMTDTLLVGNRADYGGGVYSNDRVLIVGGRVGENRVPMHGGGLVNNGALTITGGIVEGNTAGGGGGGVRNNGALTLRRTTFRGNDANFGGAMLNDATEPDTVRLSSLKVFSNTGIYAGGIWNDGWLSISGSSIAKNVSENFGGGIVNDDATLILRLSHVYSNTAATDGGGLYNSDVGMASLVRNTLSGNTAARGGGIYNLNQLDVVDSTLSGNTATEEGGGLFDGIAASLTNVTVAGNSAPTGGGIYGDEDITIKNTLVAANSGDNCNASLTTVGYNLEDADQCGLDPGMNDLINTDPLLGTLEDNGGPTLTHAVATDSPAVDAGDNAACSPADQRSRPRVDGDFDGTITCDIGAYEALISLIVNDTADEVDADAGDGVCETAPGNDVCTLRGAILEANALGGVERITVPGGSYTLTIANPAVSAAALVEDDGETGDLDIRAYMRIEGAGPSATVVDANGLDRIFHLVSPTLPLPVHIAGVTARGGEADLGGGIRTDGTLWVENSVIEENTANTFGGGLFLNDNAVLTLTHSAVQSNVGDDSGGIHSNADASLDVYSSTIRFNETPGSGGGINNGGRLRILASTIASNTAATNGGAINQNGSEAELVNVTLSGNSADLGGAFRNHTDGTTRLDNVTIYGNETVDEGAIYNDETVVLNHTLIGGNTGGNCAGAGDIVSSGYNVEDSDSCGLGGDLDDPDVGHLLLGLLRDNGGPDAGDTGAPATHALLDGSPAIDAGAETGCAGVDQRGIPRPLDGDGDGVVRCDVGAFEKEEVIEHTLYLPIIRR